MKAIGNPGEILPVFFGSFAADGSSLGLAARLLSVYVS
jgi:spore maturation protein SpmB